MRSRRFDLDCHRVDRGRQIVRIGLFRPVCFSPQAGETKRLTRLFGEKIEAMEPDFGIEIMMLAATQAEPSNGSRLSAP